MVERDDTVLRLCSATKRSIPTDLTSALRVARRLLEQARLRGARCPESDPRALFTGVADTHDFANAVAVSAGGGTDAGHVGSYRRLADTGRAAKPSPTH